MTSCVYSVVSVVSVGGFVESVNKLAVLSPWLAAVGVVGCVGTARNRSANGPFQLMVRAG